MKTNRTPAFLLHLGVWLILITLLWLLLVSASALPNESIRANMEKSALSYADKDAFSFENGKKINSISDNYADTILLNVAWNMGEGNPLTSSLDTKYYDGEEFGESYGLYLAVTEGKAPNTDYTRYWHGSAVFVRLLHLVTDVNGVKIIGFSVSLLLLALTLFLLCSKKHYDIAVLICISLCVVQIWNVRLSMEYQPAFIIAFLLCILCLLLERKSDTYVTLLCVAGGTLVCFFDFLTAETLTLLLPLMLVIAVRAKEKRLSTFRESVIILAKCGTAWLASYAGAFIAKWTAATVATGENAFAKALSFAGERVGGEVSGTQEMPNTFFSSVTANLGAMLGTQRRLDYPATFLTLAIIILLLVSVWYLFRTADGEKTAAKLLLLLGSLVLVRFLVLNNHSFIHCFFTYRALAPTVFACLAALWFNIGFVKRKRGKK
ncbi:MAG: hypothetical protein IJX55_04420 [Clostridia bacterium]|nr:hypothetical protein [Clostridia bacterium]